MSPVQEIKLKQPDLTVPQFDNFISNLLEYKIVFFLYSPNFPLILE